jgi:two-component system LytT family sensor kinase
MLLQPLIENSIKHGLEPRIDGGTVTLRSRITEDGRLLVEVEDDGVGIAPGRSTAGEIVRPGTGIGMKNVRERMQVLYGNAAEVEIESRPGRGTKVVLRMPVIEGEGGGWGLMREAVEGAVRGLRR